MSDGDVPGAGAGDADATDDRRGVRPTASGDRPADAGRATGPAPGDDPDRRRAGSGAGAGSGADGDGVVCALDDVTKRFAGERVIDDLSLTVRDGELLTLLGPSGCGKTTTLRLIAGLERPDAGTITLDGEVVAEAGPGDAANDEPSTFVPPERRDVGVVFQDFALFPHLTAAENVGFGLTDVDDDVRAARVDDLLDLVGLTDQRDSYPDELSGGQQQRVALARSLAPEPDLILLDEPFSNLDVDLRTRMREEVRRILREAGVTAVSVTHDQEEALSISDRVAVVHDGRIEQVGEPEAVFQAPRSRFVAGFLGHASFLPGRVRGSSVRTALGPIDRDRIHGLAPEYDETDVDVLVRPDDVRATPVPDGEAGDGVVVGRSYLGPTILYEVELPSGDTVECMHNHDQQVGLDRPVRLHLEATHELAWFPREQRPDVEFASGSGSTSTSTSTATSGREHTDALGRSGASGGSDTDGPGDPGAPD